MKRSPLDIVTLEGDPVDVAFKLGRNRARQIALRLEFWNRLLSRLFRGRKGDLDAIVGTFLEGAREASPAYVEELRALAEGAGGDFKDIFRLNLTELKPFAEKCSTMALPLAGRGRGIFVAHNEDWDPEQNDVFILRAKLPGVSYAILTYDGYIPGLSCGCNSHGLVHAVNYVLSRDIRPAMPRAFVTRFLVTAKNPDECLRWMRKNRRAFGQSVHMAQGSRYLGVEATATKVLVWRDIPPAFHTNHYLCGRIGQLAAPPSASSAVRQATGERLLQTMLGDRIASPTEAEARRIARSILSDRSSHPYAIWRDNDHTAETSATVATVMMATGSRQMLVWRESPDAGRPMKISLP